MAYKSYWLNDKKAHLVKVNGVEIPEPQEMKVTVYDLDLESGTGRNQAGQMMRDRVAVKEKIEMKFPPMYKPDYQTLLGMIKDASFSVTYYSPHYAVTRTATMYVGDRSTNLYYMQDGSDDDLYTDISLNFIEF